LVQLFHKKLKNDISWVRLNKVLLLVIRIGLSRDEYYSIKKRMCVNVTFKLKLLGIIYAVDKITNKDILVFA
jgi:hypothetical protein